MTIKWIPFNRENLPVLLAIGTGAGYLTMLIIIAFHELPTTSHDILIGAVGALSSAYTGILGYYFGSSSGSAKKTEMLAQSQADALANTSGTSDTTTHTELHN